jgi:glycosyltransferase involved in cell wall biosynthesis
VYKHQWHVAEGIAKLRNDGLPVALDLVGPAYSPAWARLKRTLDRIDPAGEFIRYSGNAPYAELRARYAQADLFLFASTCETFGQILTEAMFSGLPIACSHRGAMPEVLGDTAVFFDPESPDSIAQALRRLLSSPHLRTKLAESSFGRAHAFSWKRCAGETFGFLEQVASTRFSSRLSSRRH